MRPQLTRKTTVATLSGLPPRPASLDSYKGKVLVAGATGGVGKAVVQQLTDAGIPVRAIVRDTSKAASVLPLSCEIVEADVAKDYSMLVNAAQGCTGVICATGPTDRLNPFASISVDYIGTQNLIAACRGVDKFVLVTSIGCDDPLFPLNLLWGVLIWKKQGELALQKSGLDYCIVRPGGLQNDKDSSKTGSNSNSMVVSKPPDSYGLPPRQRPGSIKRSQVAAICVAALVEPSACRRVIEVITEQGKSGDDGAEEGGWETIFAVD
jgi:uncharacterized protein YbjT (DUF2867 family)